MNEESADPRRAQVMGVLLIVSVLTSGAATSQATIMPAARTTLSMASYGALPKSFARVHPKYRTPSVSTWAFGLVSLGLYVLLAAWSENVLSDSVDAVGLTIAIEYAMTALACAWVFRRPAAVARFGRRRQPGDRADLTAAKQIFLGFAGDEQRRVAVVDADEGRTAHEVVVRRQRVMVCAGARYGDQVADVDVVG